MAPANPVVVERVIDASPEAIFDLLARPARHHELDGSGQLRGDARGPDRLSAGTAFSMSMQQAKLGYRTRNEVTEFVDNERIAWRSYGIIAGRRVIGGQTWRYLLTPYQGSTQVRHEYDWKAANLGFALGLLGYPRRAEPGMAQTLRKLEHAVTGAEGTPAD